jgi:hypothetical protein
MQDAVMTDGAVGVAETIRAGGFVIEVAPDSVRVAADKIALSLSKNAGAKKVFRAILYGCFALFVVSEIASLIEHRQSTFFLGFAAIFGVSLLIAAHKSKSDIDCTRDSFRVIRKVRGKTTGTQIFSKSQVGVIKYATFSASQYGSICGLLFVVDGKKVKVLSGLEIPEAYRILGELDRLGYQVLRDVGMPMAVEMAQERRNSIFN